MTESLAALLEHCRRGDEDAVGILIQRFRTSALSLAEAILGDAHLAEDAVQESFMTALRCLGQLRDAKAFPGWFRQVVRTESHRILRRRQCVAGVTCNMPVDEDDPEASAHKSELRAVVHEAVKRLPPASQETAELFYLEQRSHSEIADLLHLSQGTVRRRLYDARQQLRNMLLGYISGKEPPEKPESPQWHLPL